MFCRVGLAYFVGLSVMLPNKPLVPTRTGEAPVLAAQRRRWA